MPGDIDISQGNGLWKWATVSSATCGIASLMNSRCVS